MICRTCILTSGILLGTLVCAQEGIPLKETPNLNNMHFRRASRLMAAKNIPDGDMYCSCTNWHFPTSISLGDVNYLVKGDLCKGRFRVYHPNEQNVPVVQGYVMRMRNGQIARLFSFLVMSENNLPIDDFAPTVSVQSLGDATNMLYVSSSLHDSNQDDVLICKNLYMRISGVTNKLDFATAIMNAGLPENERGGGR